MSKMFFCLYPGPVFWLDCPRQKRVVTGSLFFPHRALSRFEESSVAASHDDSDIA